MKRVLISLFFVLSIVTAAAAQKTPALPDLNKFETYGVTPEGVAFLVSDVDRSGKDLRFKLLIAAAEADYTGLHLSANHWSLMFIKADCFDRTFRVKSEYGITNGNSYKLKKGPRRQANIHTNIYDMITTLCTASRILQVPLVPES